MPILSCPKCSSRLRVPDGSTASVRCPKCQTVFSPPPSANKPAFEVLDDPPPPPRAKALSAAEGPPPAAKPPSRPFEVVDAPAAPPRPARAAEPERPRGRRDDEYEDDDDYRQRRRNDDRPRGRRRDYDDDYDDDEFIDRPRRGNPFGPAKVGMLLLSISMWLYLATFAFWTLIAVLVWSGSSSLDLMKLPGMMGLVNWLVALVGLAFCIAWPTKYGARGLAIAATCVAAAHLIFLFVTASQAEGGFLNGLGRGARVRGQGGFDVSACASLAIMADLLPILLVYASNLFSDFLIPILAGLFEVARLILILLLAKAVARAGKDRGAAEQAGKSVVVVSIVSGVIPVVLLLLVLAFDSKKPTTPTAVKDMQNMIGAVTMLVLLTHTGALVLPGIAVNSARAAAARMARRR